MRVVAELVGIEFHLYTLGLSWLQFHTGKALQLDRLHRLVIGCRRQIDLCYLCSCYLTRILHLELHLDVICADTCRLVHQQVLILESGIGQAIAERPLNLTIGQFTIWIVIADRRIDFFLGIADRELGRGRDDAIEDVCHSITTLLTRIPCLDDGSATLSKVANDLCTTTKEYQHDGLTRSQQCLHIFLLLTWQAQSLTVAVLATQHDVLTHRSDDDIGRVGHSQCLFLVGCLTRIYLTMQQRIFPRTLVADMRELRLNLFRPVATTRINDVDAVGLMVLETLQQRDDMRMVEIFLHLLPEERHRRERIVATHRPHGVGIRTSDENLLR